MKTSLFILAFALISSSCDSPQRSRATTNVDSSNLGTVNGSSSNGSVDFGTGTTTGTSTTTTGTTTGTVTDTNFPSCDLSYKYSTSDLGQLALCQSTVDETLFKFKSAQASTSRVCLIPTYKDATGASTWIGQPQCTLTNAGQTYSGKLYKTRNGYTGYPINGVMVMKENLLTEYFQCIDAYINYINTYCPLNPYNTVCVNNATLQRNYICNQFKQKYPDNYLDIRTR